MCAIISSDLLASVPEHVSFCCEWRQLPWQSGHQRLLIVGNSAESAASTAAAGAKGTSQAQEQKRRSQGTHSLSCLISAPKNPCLCADRSLPLHRALAHSAQLLRGDCSDRADHGRDRAAAGALGPCGQLVRAAAGGPAALQAAAPRQRHACQQQRAGQCASHAMPTTGQLSPLPDECTVYRCQALLNM